MDLSGKKITVHDMSLRDGMHANSTRHRRAKRVRPGVLLCRWGGLNGAMPPGQVCRS